jgi:hypothetical protein
MIFNYSAASVAGASSAFGASSTTGASGSTGVSTFSSTTSLTSFSSALGASKNFNFFNKSVSLFSAEMILLSLASFQILSLI